MAKYQQLRYSSSSSSSSSRRRRRNITKMMAGKARAEGKNR